MVRPEARGDLTLVDGETSNAGVVWSKTARGPYRPPSLVSGGVLCVLANAGRVLFHVATNSMGDPVMATPALPDGVMYVRSAQNLFATGKK